MSAREIAMTYGSFQIGGSTARPIDGYLRVEQDFVHAAIEVSFIITGSSAGNFASACTAAEDAFRIPRQDLTITYGGSNTVSWKQSDNTGLDSDPKIIKQESLADTGRSRRYTVRIDFGRPADILSLMGRRASSTQITYSPSRHRTVTISAVYTAMKDGATPKSAYTMYSENFGAFALTELGVVDSGVSWELVEEPATQWNSTNKTLEASIVYQELIYPDGGMDGTVGAMDHNSIIAQSFHVSRDLAFPGDSPVKSGGSGTGSDTAVGRPYKLTVSYEASVRVGVDRKTLWDGTIRRWIIDRIKKDVRSGVTALVTESPQFDLGENRIVASMEFMQQGDSRVLEHKSTEERAVESFGYVDIPVWDGNPLSRYMYQGPMIVRKTTRDFRRVIGEPDKSTDFPEQVTLTSDSFPISQKTETTPLIIGNPLFETIKVTDINSVTVIGIISMAQKSNDVATNSGSSSGANGGPGTGSQPSQGSGSSSSSGTTPVTSPSSNFWSPQSIP